MADLVLADTPDSEPTDVMFPIAAIAEEHLIDSAPLPQVL